MNNNKSRRLENITGFLFLMQNYIRIGNCQASSLYFPKNILKKKNIHHSQVCLVNKSFKGKGYILKI